jgi:hypothetical protein
VPPLARSVVLCPLQIVKDGFAVTVGVGAVFTVTVTGEEADEQPVA